MKKKETIYSKVLLYLAFLVIGIIAGIAIRHYYHIPIVESLDIVNLATLVTTVFLAVYIPVVLDKRLQIKKDKKELVEQRILELLALYRKVNIIVQSGEKIHSKELLSLNNILDLINFKLDTINTLLNVANFEASFSTEINQVKKLNKEHMELLSSPSKENDFFFYTAEIQEKEELFYGKIDKAACLLIFKISEG